MSRPHRTTPATLHCAIELRKTPTLAEAKLWARLRGNQLEGISFRRQHAIGPYIVDFCSPRQKLVIELDGSQHMQQAAYDAQRTAFLQSQGYSVLRFWNNEVMNDVESVLRAIQFILVDGER